MYGMDKIVSGGQESRYLPKLLAGDRLLLIVYGEVTAGVDLSKVEPAHVETSGRTVLIVMPPAEIFATRIDNDRTRVFSRETGLFTRPDPNLESDVRKEAEHQIRQAALDSGILRTAATMRARRWSGFSRVLDLSASRFDSARQGSRPSGKDQQTLI